MASNIYFGRFIIALPVVFNMIFPIILSSSLILKKPQCLMHVIIKTMCVGLVVLFSYIIMRWEITGISFRYALVLVYLIASIIGLVRNYYNPLIGVYAIELVKQLWIAFFVFSIFLFMILSMVGARHPKENRVDLQFPLKKTAWIIAHGGRSLLLNQHRRVATQSYALDVTAVNRWGFRAKGLLPENLNSYAIYGEPVCSPCSGNVLSVVDGYPDRSPFDMDKEHPPGNYIAISCKNVTIVLAHLKHGSISVAEGDIIPEGMTIANVGNSGNTSEPHLHIHAVKGNITDETQLFWTGEPVPMIFDGRFLIRGDRNRFSKRTTKTGAGMSYGIPNDERAG